MGPDDHLLKNLDRGRPSELTENYLGGRRGRKGYDQSRYVTMYMIENSTFIRQNPEGDEG